MEPRKHAVVLDISRCRGCTTCIKVCPTEAIRVRRGKADVLPDRCIDCGSCMHVCPHRAIRSESDRLDQLGDYRCRVAVVEPVLYSQFRHLDTPDRVLSALLSIGFDRVYETGRAAELITRYTRTRDSRERPQSRPLISSSCPTILRLIQIRFPQLIDHVDPLVMPMELSAILARREAERATGLPPEDIGVFAIVSCSAKVTAAHSPEGLEQPVLNGALAIRDIYPQLLKPMEQIDRPSPLMNGGAEGLSYALSGGEAQARRCGRYLAVDGIQNCIRMLEEIEDGRLSDVDFIELSACTQGCVGGSLCVENPYTARMRLQHLMSVLPESRCGDESLSEEDRKALRFNRTLRYLPAFRLDADLAQAMAKRLQIEALEATLPGLHCGSCGAPNCHAFAEDVVMGRARAEDCIFKVRERMRGVTGPGGADDYLPPPFRQQRPRPKKVPAE